MKRHLLSLFGSANRKWTIVLFVMALLLIIISSRVGITILDKIDKTEYISEGIVMGLTLMICVQGILVEFIVAIISAIRRKDFILFKKTTDY